jgi:hypothetical protein
LKKRPKKALSDICIQDTDNDAFHSTQRNEPLIISEIGLYGFGRTVRFLAYNDVPLIGLKKNMFYNILLISGLRKKDGFFEKKMTKIFGE